MRRYITCVLLGFLAATGPVYGLTLYKCFLLDGSGVVYQDQEPNSADCRIEKKELDPDANVVPSTELTGEQQADSAISSQGTSGIPDEKTRPDVLITGEDEALDSPPVGEPGIAPNTATGNVAPAAPLAPGGFTGP